MNFVTEPLVTPLTLPRSIQALAGLSSSEVVVKEVVEKESPSSTDAVTAVVRESPSSRDAATAMAEMESSSTDVVGAGERESPSSMGRASARAARVIVARKADFMTN